MAEPFHNGLLDLGLNAKLLISGFAGGVLQAFILRSTSPWVIVGNILAGLFTANYLGSAVGYYLHSIPGLDADAAGGFISGVCAMAIVQGFTAIVNRKLKVEGNGPKPT